MFYIPEIDTVIEYWELIKMGYLFWHNMQGWSEQ